MADDNGTTHNDVINLKKMIVSQYTKNKVAMIALCKYFAGLALREFRSRQANNAFWKNQTGSLLGDAYSDAWVTKEFVGFFLSLSQNYGKYVILANNRKHDGLTPIIISLYSKFMNAVEKIYA